MSYQDMTTAQLVSLWKEKRSELAKKPTHESIKEIGELYKLRKEIERRHREDPPTTYVDFEQYVTD